MSDSKDDDVVLRYVHFGDKTKHDKHEQCSECKQTVFIDNYISTTLYSVISFLPMNLYLQFNKKANLYFLFIAILSLFPLSPKAWWVSVLPLVFVLAVSALKEAVEDWGRHRQDQKINSSLVLAWRGGAFAPIEWREVVVGDVLKIVENGAFPADMVLLQSSLAQGVCNIETSNLDGETNLKLKKARPATYNIECAADGSDYPSKFACVTESDPPNEIMESSGWKGNFYGVPGTDMSAVPLSMEQLLLRGCVLRNTRWIIAQVLFTGRETKLMLNNKAVVFKRSMVERGVDTALYCIFAIQVILCSFGAIANYVWMNSNALSNWYLPFALAGDKISISSTAGLSWFTYLVLLDILVPISLYVSMELVKVAQGVLIDSDVDMYHADTNTPAQARTTSLNEELGQVEFIFSDKTGTLTRNMMEFLRCTVGCNAFGPGCMAEAGQIIPRLPSPAIPNFAATKFRFEDNRLVDGIVNGHRDGKQFDLYLTALAVCHDVIAEYPGCAFEHADPAKLRRPHTHGKDQCTVAVVYQAASPDEKALVEAARDCQYYFQHRAAANISVKGVPIDDAQLVQVNILGVAHSFEILASLEFNSSRKRASVVCRDPRDGRIRIFCKGADSIVYRLLNAESKGAVWDFTAKELEKFSNIGLRTLVVASKELTDDAFLAWYAELKRARSDMINRAGMVANAEALIECDLSIVGSTAIEDRLQDGVPDCIEHLGNAGIKIWVLTGDKVETAINIGRSCRLIKDTMVEGPENTLIVIDIDDKLGDDEARAETEKALAAAWHVVKNHRLGQEGQGLVISGRALGFVFPIRKLDARGREIEPTDEQRAREEALGSQLFQIATRCKAVICCRVSPKQKMQVVELVKFRVEGVTLAIGDGANDVPMIKAAHVGIGISGMEGLQATMASDYAIAQFRFLETLLLVHGARSYRRISLLILYSFYKNFCVALSNILFAFYSAFAGQLFYDALCGSLFNLFFTALPIMGAAVFNAHVSKANALAHPRLYKSGQKLESFNLTLLFAYLGEGLYQAIVCFFFSLYMFGDTVTEPTGLDNDQWLVSSCMFTYMVVVTNLKIALQSTTWTWVTHLFFWLSIAAYVLWTLVYSGTSIGLAATPDMYWVLLRMYSQAQFWWGLLLVSIVSLLPYLSYNYAQRMFWPTAEDVIHEHELGYGEDGVDKSDGSGWRAPNEYASSSSSSSSSTPSSPKSTHGIELEKRDR